MSVVAGVDIGGRAAHVVVLDGRKVKSAALWPTQDLAQLADVLAGCDVVAIDSPDRWSPGAIPEHAGLSPKFVAARCAEFELARKYRYWVPWVTPRPPQAPDEHRRYAWIERGIELFDRLAGRTATIEVYPNSIFRRLGGLTPLPSKSTMPGLGRRVELLRSAGIREEHLDMWSHDSLDASAAAVVAHCWTESLAEEVSCGHDGSAMWLPGYK